MPVAEADIKHYQSAAHPSDDTSAAGGAISSPRVEITTASVGECLPKLRAEPSGTLDTNAKTQYQTSYWENIHVGENLTSVVVYIKNALDALSGSVQLRFTPTSASDDSSKHIRVWGEVGGALVFEDRTLNGLSPVDTLQSFLRIFRLELRANSNGAPTPAAANIDVAEVGGSSIGIIPATQSYATREFALAMAAAKGDVAALTNRTTEPSGSPTWSYNRTSAGGLAIPTGALNFGERIAVYTRQIVQPGMPTADIKVDYKIHGEN